MSLPYTHYVTMSVNILKVFCPSLLTVFAHSEDWPCGTLGFMAPEVGFEVSGFEGAGLKGFRGKVSL